MQPDALLAKLRLSRESSVTVGDYTFTVRRPTDYEAARLFNDAPTEFEVTIEYVSDWKGVKESDLVPSGGSDQVEFNRDLWREWCADHPEFWSPIFQKVVDEYKKHREVIDDTGKSSDNG